MTHLQPPGLVQQFEGKYLAAYRLPLSPPSTQPQPHSPTCPATGNEAPANVSSANNLDGIREPEEVGQGRGLIKVNRNTLPLGSRREDCAPCSRRKWSVRKNLLYIPNLSLHVGPRIVNT